MDRESLGKLKMVDLKEKLVALGLPTGDQKDDLIERLTTYYAEEEMQIRQQMADVPFEDLLKAQENMGVKKYKEIMCGVETSPNKRSFKDKNKNRSNQEMRFRDSTLPRKQTSRDPRFDNLSGKFNEHIFRTAYGFLGDIKKREQKKIKKQLSKLSRNDKEESIRLKKQLMRMKNQELAQRRKDEQMTVYREWQKEQRKLVKEGKQPFFLKKNERKKLSKKSEIVEDDDAVKSKSWYKRQANKAFKEKRKIILNKAQRKDDRHI